MASYQKSRPVCWEEVVGQEHVREILETALKRGHVGHAYMFSGPRGVGKTTFARLVAMSLHCGSQLPDIPCGTCHACRHIQLGSYPDVVEIDAASNNSVDDVRQLREQLDLSPMYGGKKVYILDEAHMMSKSAFAALLKTLEEPPAHVVFILATTEPERVLPTIMSRCQHYRFRRLSVPEIAQKLERICIQADIDFEREALELMARLADGAMRDAESLLDRISGAGDRLSVQHVEAILGLPPLRQMEEVVRALLSRNEAVLFEQLQKMYLQGLAARSIVEGVRSALQKQFHVELGLAAGEVLGQKNDILTLIAALDEHVGRLSRFGDQTALEMIFIQALSRWNLSRQILPESLVQRLDRLEQSIAGVDVPALPKQDPAPEQPRPIHIPAEPVSVQHTRAVLPVSNGPKAETAAQTLSLPQILKELDPHTRAFLKPAKMTQSGQTVTLHFGRRFQFHIQQARQHLDDITRLVRNLAQSDDIRVVLQEEDATPTLEPQASQGPDHSQEIQAEPAHPSATRVQSRATAFFEEPTQKALDQARSSDVPGDVAWEAVETVASDALKVGVPEKKNPYGIQSHPLYADLKKLFPGNVLQRGKLRHREPEPTEDDPEAQHVTAAESTPQEG